MMNRMLGRFDLAFSAAERLEWAGGSTALTAEAIAIRKKRFFICIAPAFGRMDFQLWNLEFGVSASELPPFAVFGVNVIHGLAAVRRLQQRGIPIELMAGPIRHDAQQDGFSERAGISEIARGRAASFTGLNPFVMVPSGFGNERGRGLKTSELLLGQKL